MIYRPLTVDDGLVGAEVEHSPEEEAERQRKRTEQATDEMKEFSLRIARESKESIQKVLGKHKVQEARYEERLHPRGRGGHWIKKGAHGFYYHETMGENVPITVVTPPDKRGTMKVKMPEGSTFMGGERRVPAAMVSEEPVDLLGTGAKVYQPPPSPEAPSASPVTAGPALPPVEEVIPRGLVTGRGRVAPGHLARDLANLRAQVTAAHTDPQLGPVVNVGSHTLDEIGGAIEKVALRYSARKGYQKQLDEIHAERQKIYDRKWDAWEKFFHDPATTPDMVENTHTDDFLTPEEHALLKALSGERSIVLRRRDAADREALLAVLREIRPMGGTLREAEKDRYSASNVDAIEVGEMQDELGPALQDVLQYVPKKWLDDTNAKGEVRWQFSTERAWASTKLATPPPDSFREMEDAVDAALRGDELPLGQVWAAADDVGKAEGDPFPGNSASKAEQDAWRERRDARAEKLRHQRYTWVGRAESRQYPEKGLWAVIRGQDDGGDYWVDWGGNLHPQKAMHERSGTGKVIEGPRDDRRIEPTAPSRDTLIRIDPRRHGTLLHEINHRLENVYGEENKAGFRPLEMATQSFLRRRAPGEAPQKLADLYEGYGYEPGELARPDKFVDAYIGKVYPSTSTEVLTMGMEMLWFPQYGSKRDIDKDPDMRRLILGMLATL